MIKTFEEYQTLAAKVPAALRNDRDRITLPITGLQQESGKIGRLLETAFAAGKLKLTTEERAELQSHLAEVLWCLAWLCKETNLNLQEIAAISVEQLGARAKGFDPEQR